MGADIQPTGGFNSQPPEGGWARRPNGLFNFEQFQLTAARRRLARAARKWK